MNGNGVDLFASSEELDSYCARITGRLRKRWQERAEFLSSAVSRLQSLQHAAGLVQDAELEQELAARVEAARDELRQLNEIARETHLEVVETPV